MNDDPTRALLPTGLRDLLPPDAGREADVVAQIMGHFLAQGYARVKPPLTEFESTLLDGAGAATAAQAFRVMDPLSQRMLGLRADMTPQVARIAASRLAGEPRPLRLSYSGEVLRVKGGHLRPERQFLQAGIELIGSDAASADAEVAVLVAEALAALNVPGVSVDLSLPTLVPALLADLGLTGEAAADLRAGLDHKDAARVASLAGTAAPLFTALLAATGPADRALAALAGLPLTAAAGAERDRLAEVVERVRRDAPDLTLTVDPVEYRGFEYHTGAAFTLFSRAGGCELGRGGRYRAGNEPATGATLFLDSILAILPPGLPERRVYVPVGTPRAWAQALRTQGWVTVAGLTPGTDVAAEAKRLNCGHLLAGDSLIEVR